MRLFVTISFLLISTCNFAADYLVSSIDECNAAMKKLVAGDAVIWKDGSYADVKINFKPKAKGTAKDRIYLRAQTPGKVIFTGSSQIGISGEYLQVEGFTFKGTSTLAEGENVITYASLDKQDHTSKYVRVTNCAIIDYTLSNDQVENKWVLLYGDHNELDHCTFIGKKNQGATVVVNYYKSKDYVDGSETAPSTYHTLHHNHFGFRTMPNDNGGEHIRIGDSKTSFTKGFNIVEYNYFENHRIEPEVISNKSCDNIYRFNTFIGNDGALVLRHGNRCIVYGNYFDGTGSQSSGGIRIIGDHHTVFNNYLQNLTGGKEKLKAPITIMSGVVGTALNGYYTANDAVVCYNTIVNASGPVFKIGIGSKGTTYTAPASLVIANNVVVRAGGKNNSAAVEEMPSSYAILKNNFVAAGPLPDVKGFEPLKEKLLITTGPLQLFKNNKADADVLAIIQYRLAAVNLQVDASNITSFNPQWILNKSSTGVNWKL
jgi:poly(beta-D-mannuronate) lyase